MHARRWRKGCTEGRRARLVEVEARSVAVGVRVVSWAAPPVAPFCATIDCRRTFPGYVTTVAVGFAGKHREVHTHPLIEHYVHC
jgi:hypothetical protein